MPVQNDEIDFVIAWVDGSDPDWQNRKKKYTGISGTDDSPERYRDWDLLRYWFRGVFKFAPWVHKIFFICDQEPPTWLRQDSPRLKIVRHEDYLLEEFRPAFSSHPIELNMHRISDLSEHFVYFNDDTYLLAPVKEDLFFKKGLPCDVALLNPVPTTELKMSHGNGRIFTIPLNNAEYLNRDFDFRKCVRKHPLKWINIKYGKSCLRNLFFLMWNRFIGFDEHHLPQPFLKSSFERAWEQDEDILTETSKHVLRDDRDVNQWLIRERQLAEGVFIARSPKAGRVYNLGLESEKVTRVIAQQEVQLVCLNDGPMEEQDFLQIRIRMKEAFHQILPDACEVEKEGVPCE